jgi:hypothetical protein
MNVRPISNVLLSELLTASGMQSDMPGSKGKIEPSPDAVQRAIAQGAVLADVQNVCPAGTKAWMLCLGYLEADEGFLVRGGNTSLASNKDAARENKRRLLPMYCVLIEHPHEGLILWETGSGSVRLISLPAWLSF